MEIALSTMEAEYIALSQAMCELIPLRQLLLEIVTTMKLPGITDSVIKSTVFEDNIGAISTATAVKMTPHTKHIKYHFFKSYINVGTGITTAKIDTNLQKADIFTKGLAHLKNLWRFANCCAIGKIMCGRTLSRLERASEESLFLGSRDSTYSWMGGLLTLSYLIPHYSIYR
jgi:hypothetical protein